MHLFATASAAHVQVRTGVRSSQSLSEAGIGTRQRRRLIAAGELVRLTRGWYAETGHLQAAASAVRLGGRLTCVSALELANVWLPMRPSLHMRVRAGAANPASTGVVAHRLRDVPLGPSPVDDLSTALRCALHCLSPIDALIVVDSVLQKQLLSNHVVSALARSAPARVRRALAFRDGRSQSGTETIIRYNFERRGYRVRPQHYVPGVGYVDTLVGDRLIIEADSTAFHTRDEHHAEDRRRDLAAHAQGYIVVRLTYAQVAHNWDATWVQLERLLHHDRHLWCRRSRRMNADGALRMHGTSTHSYSVAR